MHSAEDRTLPVQHKRDGKRNSNLRDFKLRLIAKQQRLVVHAVDDGETM